jgi:hypothetical protein
MKKIALAYTTCLLLSSSVYAFDLGAATSMLQSTTQDKKATSTTSKPQSSSLTDMLTQSLGVNSKQAQGGVGSILSYAKENLSADKFTTLKNAVPDAKTLMALTPKSSGSSLGGLASSLGNGASSAMGLAGLTSQFSSLGLNSSMISKFVPIIMQYFKSSGSTDAMGILGSLFK